jgi:sulfate transport system permease protein
MAALLAPVTARTSRPRRASVIPGFGLTLGITVLYLGLIILLPLAALIAKSAGLGPGEFWRIATSPRALAAYRVTVGSALLATAFNALFGLALAWVLVRYRFPGHRLLDALVDIPFALPTAVSGLALTTLLAQHGWFGAPLAALGVQVAYTPLGIAVAMAFTSLPFVVRTVQPVLDDLDPEVEEAAISLGAGDLTVFQRVILPLIAPALLAGCTMAFARCLGEFGALVFIAGNQPYRTEIVALLTFIRLEEFDYEAAAAISTVMLGAAFAVLLIVNIVQGWQQRWQYRD